MKRIIRILAGLALSALCSTVWAQQTLQPFTPSGNTVTFTAATSCPTPVRATTSPGVAQQYIISNNGSGMVWVAFAATSAAAATNCVIPTGTSQLVVPVLPYSQFSMTTVPGAYFTGITSSGTDVIYVTPGAGN